MLRCCCCCSAATYSVRLRQRWLLLLLSRRCRYAIAEMLRCLMMLRHTPEIRRYDIATLRMMLLLPSTQRLRCCLRQRRPHVDAHYAPPLLCYDAIVTPWFTPGVGYYNIITTPLAEIRHIDIDEALRPPQLIRHCLRCSHWPRYAMQDVVVMLRHYFTILRLLLAANMRGILFSHITSRLRCLLPHTTLRLSYIATHIFVACHIGHAIAIVIS